MLLALRSLWESGSAAVRKGAGLLLSLQSLVLESASGDVSFSITGIAADPRIGEISQVSGTEEISTGGILPALVKLAREQEAERRKPRNLEFKLARAGVAAAPAIGEIDEIDISIPAKGASAKAKTGACKIIQIDFGLEALPLANAYIGRPRGVAADFQVADGVGASPSIAAEAGFAVETPFDLLEEELIALLLAA
jgi:hypothetical protein